MSTFTQVTTPSDTTRPEPPLVAAQRRRPRLRRFGPRVCGILMTPAEFDAAPEAAFQPHFRYEVVNGVLIVSPPVSEFEGDPNEELGHLLRRYAEEHPRGKCLDFTLNERTVPGTPNRRRCDRAVWIGLGRLPDTRIDVPAIVVEFVSRQKRDEYLAAGVREYWIIDATRRIMTVYTLTPAGPTYDVVSETQSYQTPLLPGFELPLARLLTRADAWKKSTGKRRPPAPEGSE